MEGLSGSWHFQPEGAGCDRGVPCGSKVGSTLLRDARDPSHFQCVRLSAAGPTGGTEEHAG